jgi:hypothetical protein
VLRFARPVVTPNRLQAHVSFDAAGGGPLKVALDAVAALEQACNGSGVRWTVAFWDHQQDTITLTQQPTDRAAQATLPHGLKWCPP